MVVYLLIRSVCICVQGYEVANEETVIGVYSTRKKAFEAMWDYTDDYDPMVDYRIEQRQVM